MQVSHVYTFVHQYCLTINVHCSRFCFSYFELFTSLITLLLLFIAVLAAHSQESVRTCIDVLEVLILLLFLTIFLSNFETVRQCGIFCLTYYYTGLHLYVWLYWAEEQNKRSQWPLQLKIHVWSWEVNVFSEQILENTEWVITEKTGNIPMMRKNVTKHTTQYMFDTSKSNQTQIT
jgi:hypothetical protein